MVDRELLKAKNELEVMKKSLEKYKKFKVNIYKEDSMCDYDVKQALIKISKAIDKCLDIMNHYQKPAIEGVIKKKVDGSFWVNDKKISDGTRIEPYVYDMCSESYKWNTKIVKSDYNDEGLRYLYTREDTSYAPEIKEGEKVRYRK